MKPHKTHFSPNFHWQPDKIPKDSQQQNTFSLQSQYTHCTSAQKAVKHWNTRQLASAWANKQNRLGRRVVNIQQQTLSPNNPQILVGRMKPKHIRQFFIIVSWWLWEKLWKTLWLSASLMRFYRFRICERFSLFSEFGCMLWRLSKPFVISRFFFVENIRAATSRRKLCIWHIVLPACVSHLARTR